MKKFKVGVVGIGGIAKYTHLPSLKAMENVEVVAVCDIIPTRCDEADKILGVKTEHFTDYNKMMDMNLDAVHLCVPNYLHSAIAIAALNKGINVFCEKPDAICVSEVLKMEKAYKDSGKILMVMRNNRFTDAAKLAKDYIDKGEMGEVYCGRAGWIRRRGIPGKGGWFTTKAQSGGGPLIDLGVHMIDLACYLMGSPTPVSVSGCTYRKFEEDEVADSIHSGFGDKISGGVFDVEDLAMGFIRFDNGACLQIEFSWASNIESEKNFVELRGTKSGLSIELAALKIFSERVGQLINITPSAGKDDGHPRNITHFYKVLEGKEQPCFKPSEGVNMIKILEAMYLSAKTGKEISI